MDKSVKGTPTNSVLSKVAKKRIAAVIALVIFAVLLVSLSSSERILGTWELHKKSNNDGEDIVTYKFEEGGLGVIYDKISSNSTPHNIRHFGYALDDSKLIITENGNEQVYNYSFTFNKLYFNDATKTSLNYAGSFSPLTKCILITLLALFILWCMEDDLNTFLRSEGRWRKRLDNKKRRICAAVAFAVCLIFLLIAFLPSLRLPGTWVADAQTNNERMEYIPAENRTATYTFNSDMTGRYQNTLEGEPPIDETFKYVKEDVLSIRYQPDSRVPNEAFVLVDNPDIKVPGKYTANGVSIERNNIKPKGATSFFYKVVFDSVTYEFKDDGTGIIKVNSGTLQETEDSAPITFSAESASLLTPSQKAAFADVSFTFTTEEDLVLTFADREEIYEYGFWFDTLFLDRVGNGDMNTYDALYTIDTWFSPTFKLTIAVIAFAIGIYFMSVDITEHKKKKEDKKKLKEAAKAKKKVAAK